MEPPLHQRPFPLPLPLPPPAPAQPQDAAVSVGALLQQAVAARALVAREKPPPAPAAVGGGREQCPRCASRDTKFCYYNNYNTAQPRHFCRACRRYWTLGGSLRNVPVGGSTRKRPRPARPTRAIAAAVAAAAAADKYNNTPTATAATSCGAMFASSAPAMVAAPAPPAMQGLLSSLLLGPGPASSPPLDGRLGFGLGLGQPVLADSPGQQLGFGAGPLLWPAATILEGNRAEEAAPTTWKATGGVLPLSLPPAAALWQELAAAAPVDAGGLLPHLLL